MGVQSVSVAEQVQGLEAVDLAVAAQQRLLVLSVDRRLAAWAEWTDRAERGDTAFIGKLAGAITGVGGDGGTADVSGMPDDIYDTDRAVLALTDRLREVVRLEYFRSDLLQEQRADHVGVGVRQYRRLLRDAQQKIVFSLKAPPRKASSVAERLLTRRKCAIEC